MQQGIEPERIAFVSYTRKSVQEAAQRAAERFKIDARRFINFRTLHSTCYHQLGVMRNEVMSRTDYKDIGNMLGISFNLRLEAGEGIALGEVTGDHMLQLINLSHAKGVPLRDVWHDMDHTLDWFKLKLVNDTVKQYKQDMGKIDFDDMLQDFVTNRIAVDVDVAIIDEAQDLSNAQWDVAKSAFRNARYIEIAGDDDQAIYAWSGANVERFMAIKGDTHVLNQSYRIPRSVHNLSQSVISQVGQRFNKEFCARDVEGSVAYHDGAHGIDITNKVSWLLLARNAYFLKEYQEVCTLKGLPYMFRGKPSVDPDHVRAIVLWERLREGKELSSADNKFVQSYSLKASTDQVWFDALRKIPLDKREYYLSILRSGYRLQDKPLIQINTIHGVKGGEADNVVLMTDMTTRSYNSMQLNADNEHRVFYVGATRARENLHIIQPQTIRGYTL